MLGACFGSVIGIEVGNNEGTKLGLWYDKVIGKAFGPIHIFSFGTCDGTELGSNDGAADSKFEVLLMGLSIVYLYGIEFGGT